MANSYQTRWQSASDAQIGLSQPENPPICRSHDAKLALAPYIDIMTELTVWHDGTCPLCRREIALMRKLDRAGAITFIDAADGDSACPVDRADLLARFHACEDGKIVSGAAAFAAMWRAIPWLRPLGLAARLPWVLAILELAYVRFLRIRPRLQRFAGKRGTA